MQDPKNSKISVLKKAEGKIDSIDDVQWGALGQILTEGNEEMIKDDMRQWLVLNKTSRGEYTTKSENFLEVKNCQGEPKRGRGVFAKRDIKPFEVIGPYAGMLHLTQKSLDESMKDQSREGVLSYLFGTRCPRHTIDGYRVGNVLSLVNTAQMPKDEKPWAKNNLTSVTFGKNLVFYVAFCDIKAGNELLIDYGDDYGPMQND